jgi:glycosyltransferase involved in cell wall biosynthesis
MPRKEICILPHFQPHEIGGVAVHVRALTRHLEAQGWRMVQRPDGKCLVHTHALTRAPQVDAFTCHGVYPLRDVMPRWQREANSAIFENLKLARQVIAVSQWSSDQFSYLTGVKPHIIPNGIDLADWQNVPTGYWRGKLNVSQGTPLVVWGKTSISEVLDPTPLLELALQNPDVLFATPLPPNSIPVTPANLRCLGPQSFPRMQQLIADCDVYLATVCENHSIQVLEAMACGRPILGYAHGGTTETVPDSCGRLVPAGDLQALNLALPVVYEQRKAMGSNARTHVAQHYTWDRLIKGITEVYGMAQEQQAKASAPGAVKCSIIIPLYNKAAYVAETIQSALNQQGAPNYEVIVVNDGSTDDSLNAARKAAGRDTRIRVFDRVNAGVSAARNFGIAQAQGEYICCLDADDWIDPLFLARLAPALDSDPGLGIAYSDFISFGINEEGKPWQGYITCSEYDFAQLRKGNFMPCCNLFRKVAWERAGGYKPINPSWEDYELWLNMGKLGWYGRRVPQGLFHYRKVIAQGRDHESQGHAWKLRGIVNRYHRDLYAPTVSFIVPCYQQSQFLSEALDSVMAQTFPDWEVIVVDDGNAEDEAHAIAEVAARYPADAVRVLRLAENSGLATARNSGVTVAKGTWLVMLDADDKLAPTYLEQTFRATELNPRKFAYTDSYLWWPVEDDRTQLLEAHDYDFNDLLAHVTWACTILLSKDAFNGVGGYKPQMSSVGGWEDWELAISLGENGICGVRVAEPLFYYRQHSKEQMRYKAEAVKPRLQETLRRLHAATYRGERSDMCCGSGARQTRAAPSNQQPVRGLSADPAARRSEEPPTVLVRYVGAAMGKQRWLGAGNRPYEFGLSQPLQQVLTSDLPIFEGRRDFQVVTV